MKAVIDSGQGGYVVKKGKVEIMTAKTKLSFTKGRVLTEKDKHYVLLRNCSGVSIGFQNSFKEDDVLSALAGLREDLEKEHVKQNVIVSYLTISEMLALIDKWFPFEKEAKDSAKAENLKGVEKPKHGGGKE